MLVSIATAAMRFERHIVLLCVQSILADVCINSVFLHSTTSMLPSSQLLCVINENGAKRVYDEPVAIGTLKELDKLIPPHQQRRIANLNLNDVVMVEEGDGVKTPLEYPTSVFSNKCTGTAFIPIGRNFSSECNLSWKAFNSSECTKTSFLNAIYYARYPFVVMFDNGSALVDAQSSDIRRSVWSNELCRDVATKVRLTFLTDGRNVTNVTFEFGYDTVTRENFTTIHYQIEVFFEDSSSADRVTPPDTSSSDGNSQGYDLLDPILTSDGYFKLPFRHHCNDSGTVQIRFGVDITTGCKMIVSECASLRWQIKQLFTSFEYLNISSSPSLRSSQANVFIDSEPPTTRSSSVNCDLTTSVTVEIGFARQGDQLNFKRRIISVAYRYAQAQPYSLNEYPQNTIPIVFFVHFVDISTPATNVFARMPTINLALPSDFFYPFLTSSAQQHFVKFCLIYATALAVLLLARTIFEYRT